MARRLHRSGEDLVEVIAVLDQNDNWQFRNPRSGHWQTGNIYSRAPGQRHRGWVGGPSDEELASARVFRMRYVIDGRESFELEVHPRGVGPRGGKFGEELLADRRRQGPPPPDRKSKSPPYRRLGEREEKEEEE